jgi:hypothetical protein
LIDAIGDLRSTLRDRFGEKVATPLIAGDRSFFARRIFGTAGGQLTQGGLAEDIISALEARALWSRYGL